MFCFEFLKSSSTPKANINDIGMDTKKEKIVSNYPLATFVLLNLCVSNL